MKSVSKLSFVLLAVFAFSGQAQALPRVGQASFIPESTAEKVSFEGILAIRDPMGGCSASLVRYDISRPEDQALALTNGHCTEGGFIDPGTFLLNEPSDRTFKIVDPIDAKKDIGSLKAEKIIYGTMTKTDISLYRLTSTYAEIEQKYGIRPLVLATEAPADGTPIEIPSGYWRRAYACEIETTVPTLREEDWTWKSSLRYSRPGCETIGGTSGSPIVAAGSNVVIGINNTGNESGEKCTMNNPCEVDRDGKIFYEKGFSYGQQIHWIYSCLDNNLNFDLKAPDCVLPGGTKDKTQSIRVR
jgi:V8-like Glu-specific endopeptidase